MNSLKNIPLFKNLSLPKLELVANKVKVETFNDKEKVIIEGEQGTKLYILKTGKAEIYVKGNYIRTLNEKEYFGERSLFYKEPRSATVIAEGALDVFVLEQDDLQLIFEKKLKDYLIHRLSLQDETVQLSDLDYVKELGAGNFGAVCLVRSKKTKNYYAIKAISKGQIECDKLIVNIDMEKGILLKIDHPFIVKLVKCLKSKKHLLFLMEYVRGKELWEVIREIGLLNKYQTQFYGGSIMMALDYLHERKIIYRDIKPENILVCETVK